MHRGTEFDDLRWKRDVRYGFRHCKFLRAKSYRDRSRVAPSALTRDRAMVPDADSRVDAYMCHETIKPVAPDKSGVTGCDAFRLRGRPCQMIRNRVMSGRACIA